jgi:2-oxo-4-hydroxy-4-carboxy-5-ureidoimidazoline decarboxylase
MTTDVNQLNALDTSAAASALQRCCGASRWAHSMAEARPFQSQTELLATADALWQQMEREDILEAFSHHPKIGADIESLRRKFASTQAWASREQAGVSQASEAVLEALRDGNQQYEHRFGYIFIVCASGKSAQEMLDLLTARLNNSPEEELTIAAGEQAKITRLRLEKLSL